MLFSAGDQVDFGGKAFEGKGVREKLVMRVSEREKKNERKIKFGDERKRERKKILVKRVREKVKKMVMRRRARKGRR